MLSLAAFIVQYSIQLAVRLAVGMASQFSRMIGLDESSKLQVYATVASVLNFAQKLSCSGMLLDAPLAIQKVRHCAFRSAVRMFVQRPYMTGRFCCDVSKVQSSATWALVW